jgi:hypothetical protein
VEPPHHFVRTSYLRLDLAENLISLCWDCHRALHDGDRSIEFKVMRKRDTSRLRVMVPHWGGWMDLDEYLERAA